jgi:hypothetical protein
MPLEPKPLSSGLEELRHTATQHVPFIRASGERGKTGLKSSQHSHHQASLHGMGLDLPLHRKGYLFLLFTKALST